MDTNIQKYKAFITTVETGSFSKAAEVLNYSQSGISRMIKDIEDEWRVSLLERSKKGVKLTSDGTKLLPYARSLVREYEALGHALDGLSGLEAGLIKIGAFQGISRQYLAELTGKFSRDFPGIDFEIKFAAHGQVEQWLMTGQTDIGFLRFPASADMESEFVYQDRLIAVMPDAADEMPLRISLLQNEPFILYELHGEDYIRALLKRCNVSPQIKFTVTDVPSAVNLVRAGAGVAILPENAVREIAMMTPGLSVKELDVPAYIEVGAAVRSRRESSVAVRRFLEYI